MRRGLAVILLALATGALWSWAARPPGGPVAITPSPTGASVLLIVTDDQRWDTLEAMPNVRRSIGDRGVTFTSAFASNPLCCPSRVSILTGDLSRTTGVYRVAPPYGGFVSFDDRATLATRLDDAGYATGLFGKYLDAYQSAGLAGYVPPGWDRWVAPIRSRYTDLVLNVDGSVVEPPPDAYATDLFGADAESFIRGTVGPLFVLYAPPAPHEPALPAPRDVGASDDLPPWRPPSFDRVGDEAPAYLRALPKVDRAAIDALRRRQYDSLRAVDRQVAALVDALEDTGRLDDAVLVFTSDNGLSWGEHRWTRKEVPYDESIRIPLVIRWSEGQAGVESDSLVANVDIAPTIVDAVGLAPISSADGVGLTGLLRMPDDAERDDVVLEHMEGTNPVPTYCGVRTEDLKLVRYATGEEEMYDLAADPYELTNIAGSDPRRAELAARLDEGCRPRPPGWFDGRGGPAAAAVVALALGLARWSRRQFTVVIA